MSNSGWRFTVRGLLVIIAVLAIICAAAFTLPVGLGAIIFLAVTTMLPGILGTIAYSGGDYAKCFCLGAMVPLIFVLYSVGWGFGWTIFNSATPTVALMWFNANGNSIKAVLASGWFIAAVAGTICVVLRWQLKV